jgi:ribosomal protein S18 acetylase RimI-like enzyme
MKAAFDIAPARSADDVAAVAELLRAYAASLPVDLGYQGFDDELARLPGKYAPPGGDLLLARDAQGRAIGCAGLRPLDAERCEMKRLFLSPAARGLGLGRALAEAVIEAARRSGRRELLLDTLPSMTAAIGMYETLGFERTDAYYAPTPPGTIFMRLAL